MTRLERLAQQEARAKTKLEKERQRHAEVQRLRQEEDRRQRAKRYQLIGQMLDSAGLLALSDADLAALVRLLAPLAQVPNPVVVLESLLGESERLARGGVDGCAQAAPGVAPGGASLDTVQ
jgi:hypothetical protein